MLILFDLGFDPFGGAKPCVQRWGKSAVQGQPLPTGRQAEQVKAIRLCVEGLTLSVKKFKEFVKQFINIEGGN